MKYANVVVHVPFVATGIPQASDADVEPLPRAWLNRSFTYDIPPDLADAIRVGQLVWVPFGARQLQGVVVGLSETTDIDKTRPLEAIVYAEPLVTLQQIDLAHWLSETYLAPLSDCIWLFLPPGIEEKVETILEVAPDAHAEELTEKQRFLVEKVRASNVFKTTELSLSQRSMADTLVKKGVLLKRTNVRPPKARAKQLSTVRLIVPMDTARAAISGLDRRTLVLRALAAADKPVTERELVEQMHVTDATLERLEKQKLIERTVTSARYSLTKEYWDKVPGLPTDQARICVYLREHGESAALEELERAVPVTKPMLDALQRAGWIVKQAETVNVQLREQSKIPELSAAHARMLRVVELLAQEQAEMWVSAIYAASEAKYGDLKKLEQLGLVALGAQEVVRDPLAGRKFTPTPPPQITNEQQAAWREIEQAMGAPLHPPPTLQPPPTPPSQGGEPEGDGVSAAWSDGVWQDGNLSGCD